MMKMKRMGLVALDRICVVERFVERTDEELVKGYSKKVLAK